MGAEGRDRTSGTAVAAASAHPWLPELMEAMDLDLKMKGLSWGE